MKKPLLSLAVVILGLALPSLARADSWTLTLFPGADISGPAGSTIGWGFTIDNLSSSTLMLVNLSADVFQHATPNANIFSLPLVDPNSMLTVDYNPGTDGLYELTWYSDAPIGFINSGTFLVSAEWCDPTLTVCTSAPNQSAGYSATVTASTTIPEPATLVLLCTGLGVMAVSRKRLD